MPSNRPRVTLSYETEATVYEGDRFRFHAPEINVELTFDFKDWSSAEQLLDVATRAIKDQITEVVAQWDSGISGATPNEK